MWLGYYFDVIGIDSYGQIGNPSIDDNYSYCLLIERLLNDSITVLTRFAVNMNDNAPYDAKAFYPTCSTINCATSFSDKSVLSIDSVFLCSIPLNAILVSTFSSEC